MPSPNNNFAWRTRCFRDRCDGVGLGERMRARKKHFEAMATKGGEAWRMVKEDLIDVLEAKERELGVDPDQAYSLYASEARRIRKLQHQVDALKSATPREEAIWVGNHLSVAPRRISILDVPSRYALELLARARESDAARQHFIDTTRPKMMQANVQLARTEEQDESDDIADLAEGLARAREASSAGPPGSDGEPEVPGEPAAVGDDQGAAGGA